MLIAILWMINIQKFLGSQLYVKDPNICTFLLFVSDTYILPEESSSWPVYTLAIKIPIISSEVFMHISL